MDRKQTDRNNQVWMEKECIGQVHIGMERIRIDGQGYIGQQCIGQERNRTNSNGFGYNKNRTDGNRMDKILQEQVWIAQVWSAQGRILTESMLQKEVRADWIGKKVLDMLGCKWTEQIGSK